MHFLEQLREQHRYHVAALTTAFRERLHTLNADKKTVKAQIQDSSAVIRKRAQQTLKEVREIVGLPTLKS